MAGDKREEQLLDLLAAARRLRITPELLLFYVKYGAKGTRGRRLSMVEGAALNLFRAEQIDEFDAFLRAPWGELGVPRPTIPKGVKDYLKVEAGGGCARCVTGAPLEEAHIEPWETSFSHHHHNLLRLCRNCHRLFDEKVLSRSDIEAVKARCIETVQRRLSTTLRAGWPIVGAPSLSSDFFGRKTECELIGDALATGQSVLIEGMGGIGKTQLALHALRVITARRPVIWISVESLQGAEELEEVVMQRALAAGLMRAESLARLLDDGRACIVLDGVERLPEARDAITDFIERLVGETSDTLIVVTSQMSLPSFVADRRVQLRPLDADASSKLFLRDIEAYDRPSKPTINALLAFADGHPLTLRVLSALVRHLCSAEEVLRRLSVSGAAAIRMPRRRIQNQQTSLELSLAVAFADLTIEERRLLWAIAMSPAGLRPQMHSLEALDIPDPIAAAAELRSWNLIGFERDPAFELSSPLSLCLVMLSPVRVFVLQEMEAESAETRGARERTFALHIAFFIAELQSNYRYASSVALVNEVMERELPNALATFELAQKRSSQDEGFVAILTSLANSMMMFLFVSGRFALGQWIMRNAAATAARRAVITDAIQFLLQMQILAQRANDKPSAAFALAEAERLGAGATGQALALLLQIRASAAEGRSDYRQAAAFAREALAILDGLDGEEYQAGLVAFQLGRAFEFGGDPSEALRYFRRALKAFEDEEDPINCGSALHHVGNCEAYAENWRVAVDSYREAGSLFVKLGAVEFISNALGEAGLILPMLDPIEDLPGRNLIEAGLRDILNCAASLTDNVLIRPQNFRVMFKKFGGLISLAVHTGNQDLLKETADTLADEILLPAMEQDPTEWPEGLRIMIWHGQWVAQLCDFLSAEVSGDGPFSKEQFGILTMLASRGFVPNEHALMAQWLSSYLVRVRGMDDITPNKVLAAMDVSDWSPL